MPGPPIRIVLNQPGHLRWNQDPNPCRRGPLRGAGLRTPAARRREWAGLGAVRRFFGPNHTDCLWTRQLWDSGNRGPAGIGMGKGECWWETLRRTM